MFGVFSPPEPICNPFPLFLSGFRTKNEYGRFPGSVTRKSQTLPEFQFLLDFANRTRGGIALSVLQHDQVLALEHWLKLLDLVNVDDYRAVTRKNRCGGRWDSNEVMLSRST